MPNVDPKSLYGELLTTPGATFDQSAMDRTIERLTLVVSEQGICLCPRAPARRARARHPRDQRDVRDRPGAAHLHRAHQRQRQPAHARLRRAPGVPPGGRRCLQSAAGRQGQEAPAGAGLLQGRGHQAPAGNGTGSRRARCRSGRAVDRRAVLRCWLLDQRGRDRRRQHHGAQPAGQGSVPAPQAGRLGRAPAGRPELHRAALPRSQPGGRLRPVPQGDRLLLDPAVQVRDNRWHRCGSASRCRRICG